MSHFKVSHAPFLHEMFCPISDIYNVIQNVHVSMNYDLIHLMFLYDMCNVYVTFDTFITCQLE